MLREPIEGSGHKYTWTLTQGAPVGDSGSNPGAADRTVQFVGAFSGATVAMKGSNNGDDWHTLHDGNGAEISVTAPGIAWIAENPQYIKPEAVGAAPGTSIDVILVSRGRL